MRSTSSRRWSADLAAIVNHMCVICPLPSIRPSSSVAPGAIGRESPLWNFGSVLAIRRARNVFGLARFSGTCACDDAAAKTSEANRLTVIEAMRRVTVSPSSLGVRSWE